MLALVVAFVATVGYYWVCLLLLLEVVAVVGSMKICWCCECINGVGFYCCCGLLLSVLLFVLSVVDVVAFVRIN